MAIERITVEYVELTEEESNWLLEEVKKDFDVNTLEELQEIMQQYDAQMIPSARHLLEEAVEEDVQEPSVTEEVIEVFPKTEGGKRYRIPSSKKPS